MVLGNVVVDLTMLDHRAFRPSDWCEKSRNSFLFDLFAAVGLFGSWLFVLLH